MSWVHVVGAKNFRLYFTKTTQNVLVGYLRGILVVAEQIFGVVRLHAQDRRKLLLRFSPRRNRARYPFPDVSERHQRKAVLLYVIY